MRAARSLAGCLRPIADGVCFRGGLRSLYRKSKSLTKCMEFNQYHRRTASIIYYCQFMFVMDQFIIIELLSSLLSTIADLPNQTRSQPDLRKLEGSKAPILETWRYSRIVHSSELHGGCSLGHGELGHAACAIVAARFCGFTPMAFATSTMMQTLAKEYVIIDVHVKWWCVWEKSWQNVH